MEEVEYSIDFVNSGKPFKMPNWTTRKHENALLRLAKFQKEHKDIDDDKLNNEFKYFVIHETLSEIDESVSIEDIRNMHPLDLVELFNAVYNAGRKGIIAKKNFQKPTPKKKK